jgi:hypothetical protein
LSAALSAEVAAAVTVAASAATPVTAGIGRDRERAEHKQSDHEQGREQL